VDTLEGIVANDHPWIRQYFHGARGRQMAAKQEDDRGT
jgi:ABC-type transporter Mla maintaining outer membrane lipid asymmetry ATPase subunit MlaF